MIKTNVEVITPAVAAEYLRLYNQSNRKPNKAQVSYYAKMMSDGAWELNGESIKFSGSGQTLRLLDGQHRLMACVEANVPFETLVVRDVEEKTFDTLDQGWLRKKGQIFSIANIPNSNNVSAAINKYLNMGLHSITSMRAASVTSISQSSGAKKISPREALDEYNRDPIFWQNLHKLAEAMYRRCRLMAQADVSAIIAHLVLRHNYEMSFVVDFFEQLFYEERTELDVIRQLRQRLINDAMNSTARLTSQMKTQLIRKTWDFYKANRSPAVLKWSKGVEEERPFE